MQNRIAEERLVIELMIRMYCQHKEHNKTLCPECSTLLDYALRRLNKCRFTADKPTCRKCPIHCYRNDMRKMIKTVMRWSGPRMLRYHPIVAVRHLIKEI